MMISVQINETTPIVMVETSGVRCLGWTRPNAFGIAPKRAIERVVLAVGRMVACVDAEAEGSTRLMSSLSHGVPKTSPPNALSTSSPWCLRKIVPEKDWADADTA